MNSLLRRIPAAIAVTLLFSLAAACVGDSDWEKYEDWRTANNDWYQEQLSLTNPDGTKFYTELTPAWYPNSGVLIHYFNDRKLTEGNLSPLENSTVDMIYIGRYYNDVPFDSSYTQTAYGDSIFRTTPADVIDGWQIALNDMRIGDSCRIVVPFQQAYGTSGYNSIPPYSVLQFDMKLVAIPAYEIRDPKD